jgi:DNA-binding MarR family transcriptional regulator
VSVIPRSAAARRGVIESRYTIIAGLLRSAPRLKPQLALLSEKTYARSVKCGIYIYRRQPDTGSRNRQADHLKKIDIDPNACNNAVLRQATRRMGQLYDEVVSPSGLKATQSSLLAQIHRLDGPTMRELADAIIMDLSALSHTLKPLVRDELVKLKPDVDDRRMKRVLLTTQGRYKLAEAMRLWRTAQDSFEAAFGQKRAAELRRVLSFVASEEFSALFLAKRARSRQAGS